MPKKLPYGQSNFADIIEGGYAYVDKTRYVELLENENNTYQFMLRPRRFGKSLFLSVLENYYDLNRKDKFESIFSGLYIGKNPTPEQGKYAVVRFDFSNLNTDCYEEFKRSFLNRILEAAEQFLKRYKHVLTDAGARLESLKAKPPCIGAMDSLYSAASLAGIKIFVIIDEYDHFANNLIAMGQTYTKEVKAGGIVRVFYESLKMGTASVVKRIFITGVSPIMLSDLTSGFNMATDCSLFPQYNEMFGFTSEEVEWLIRETGVDRNLIKVDMESYYNGYMFTKYGKNKVYNSQMVLYLFSQVLTFGKQPKNIVDANLQTDYERLRRLVESGSNRELLLQIVRDGGIVNDIVERFSIDQLENDDYFVSLLFYLGMLTDGGAQRGRTWLKIPNYSVKTLYWQYMVSCVQRQEEVQASIIKLSKVIDEMAFDGDIKPYLDYFTENFLKRLSNRDLMNFDEKYIKVMLLSTLFVSRLYLPVSEGEVTEGYTDIYLQKHPAIEDIKFEYVFEIKYVKTETDKAIVETKFEEALKQIEKYKTDPRFAGKEDIKFVAVVFKGKGDYESRVHATEARQC